jgi:hypothetical protein
MSAACWVMESRSECSKRSSLRSIEVWRVGGAETPYIPIPQQASDVPAGDRFQTICSAVGTRCRTGPFIFVMARTRRYSIEIRNGNSESVLVTAADWDEEDRRAAVAQILQLDGVLGLGKASDMGRGFSQSEGSDSCAYHKLYPTILMMKSAKDRPSDHLAEPLDRPLGRRILV